DEADEAVVVVAVVVPVVVSTDEVVSSPLVVVSSVVAVDCVTVCVEVGSPAGSRIFDLGTVEPPLALAKGAPPSCRSRALVSAGRPVGIAASWSTAPCRVPFSPGWIGRYSPFGHQMKAANAAVAA